MRVLIAIESGSRAWGFPSNDSDFDVRFIYAHYLDDYLSVRELRDVIEMPLLPDNTLGVPLDLSGWDLRKALQLAIKSNPVLVEWLVSPIRYSWDEQIATDLLAFAEEVANLQTFEYHYYRLAMNAWEQIQQNPLEVKLKLYCYALRPTLSLQWILQYESIPPMDVPSLCDRLIKDEKLQDAISNLINLKAQSKEQNIIPRNYLLDYYINLVLERKPERPLEVISGNIFLEKADNLFRKFIS